MKTNHTKGKWFIEDKRETAIDRDGLSVRSENSKQASTKICTIFNASRFGITTRSEAIKEVQANAKLIATAPELLECCLSAKAMYEAQGINEKSTIGGEQYSQLVKTIEKATT